MDYASCSSAGELCVRVFAFESDFIALGLAAVGIFIGTKLLLKLIDFVSSILPFF